MKDSIRVASFADRLKEYRETHQLTLQELSNITNVPAQTLNRYELGQRVPKVDMAVKIADSLGINSLWLQGYDASDSGNDETGHQERTDFAPKTAEDLRALLHGTNTAVIMTKGENGQTIIELTPEEANLAKSLIETLRKQKENEKE